MGNGDCTVGTTIAGAGVAVAGGGDGDAGCAEGRGSRTCGVASAGAHPATSTTEMKKAATFLASKYTVSHPLLASRQIVSPVYQFYQPGLEQLPGGLNVFSFGAAAAHHQPQREFAIEFGVR